MPADSSAYRFAGPVVVRLMSAGLVLVGLVEAVLAVLVATVGLPALTLLAGPLLLVALLGLVVALRRRPVALLDEDGYQVRWVRGAGVKQSGWKDVEDVTAVSVAGERCVLLRLRDGRTTTIPVGVLAGSEQTFVRDLQQHLQRGHGYRTAPRGRG